MAIKKDKQKVLGETFDEDRLKTFLHAEPRDKTDTDYIILERAYRGMHEENFATFIDLFIDAGKNINATNANHQTLLQEISEHKMALPYVKALKTAGAQ